VGCPQAALAVVPVEYSRAVVNGRLFGFVETGWEPVPYAVLSVVAEAVAVLAAGVWAVRATRGLV